MTSYDVTNSLLGDAALLDLSMADRDVLPLYVSVDIILVSSIIEPSLLVVTATRDVIVSLLGDAGDSS